MSESGNYDEIAMFVHHSLPLSAEVNSRSYSLFDSRGHKAPPPFFWESLLGVTNQCASLSPDMAAKFELRTSII